MEERFISVEVDIPQITSPSSMGGQRILQQWLGSLCGKVFSKGFKLFMEGEFNKSKMRSYCCENILHNIISLAQKNNFGNKEFRFINECLKREIIPHLLRKYPKSEDSEINLKLFKLIRKVDNFEDNGNDLIMKSGVNFEFKESG